MLQKRVAKILVSIPFFAEWAVTSRKNAETSNLSFFFLTFSTAQYELSGCKFQLNIVRFKFYKIKKYPVTIHVKLEAGNAAK